MTEAEKAEINNAILAIKDSIAAGYKFELSQLQNEIAALKKRLADALIP